MDTLGWGELKLAVARVASHGLPAPGAVVLDVACFAEAERLYMLVRDTAVHGQPLTALVLPDVLVSVCCGGSWGHAAFTASLSNNWGGWSEVRSCHM